MTIGQRLRAAREAKDLTIGDIARRTNIQPRFLQAIDEDNLGIIPQSHQKLFIREYAKLAGLEPDVVLAELPDYVPPPPPPPSDRVFVDNAVDSDGEMGDAPPRKPSFDLRRNFPSLPHKRGVKMSGSNASNLLIAAAVVLLAVIAVWYFLLRDPSVTTDTAEGNGIDTTGAPTDIITGEIGSGDTTTTAGSLLEGDSLTLEGRATASVWFSMLMDGQRSDDGTLDSGTTRVWRASETFRLSLGNAGGLELYLNDKPLGTLGPKLSAVRNQVIDANGIQKKGTTPAPRRTNAAAATRSAPRSSTRSAASRNPRRATASRPAPRELTPAEVRPPGAP